MCLAALTERGRRKQIKTRVLTKLNMDSDETGKADLSCGGVPYHSLLIQGRSNFSNVGNILYCLLNLIKL